MLDLPDRPTLDKAALIGKCRRLALRFDAEQLRGEILKLPATLWGTTGGRVGVHAAAEALFLRGHAPAQGELPIADREPLAMLPYARHLIESLIPAPPMRCLLAKLPGGVVIAPHIDRAPYFAKTIRLHFPVISHDQAWMYCSGESYVMKPGEVWALNNSTTHGVWNADSQASRLHMICDFLLSDALAALLADANADLGQRNLSVEKHIGVVPTTCGAG